jgi:hypothetical protein
MSNFKNLSTELTLQYKIAEEKCNQICSWMKTRKKCDFALYPIDIPEGEVKIRSFVKGILS